MPEKRTVVASTDDLRTILVLIHSTLAYGATAVALVFIGGWAFVGIKDDIDVPVMLPLLAIASVAFAIVAWTSHEEVQNVGKAYRASARSDVIAPE